MTRFLLVEDDDDHAELIGRLFRQRHPEIDLLRVSDGAEALAYLRGPDRHPKPPSLVLLDLNLPLVSGLEVLKEMKADNDLTLVPIVMLTSSDSSDDVQEAYRNHVNSYLVKPGELVGFRSLVDSVVEYWTQWNLNPELA